MNCINHPTMAAVAQCADCGAGLCIECANIYKPNLCVSCFRRRKKADIINNTYRLFLYVVLFVVGYKLNFLAFGSNPDMEIATGYLLVSGLAGYVFVNYIMPWKMIAGTTGQWNFYYIFKLVLYVGAGLFVAPFAIGWTIFKLIRAIKM